MTDILYIPVAWAIYVRDDQTDWRRYSMHDYLPVAERAVERMSGPPLQFQIVPLYHDPRAFTEDELTKLRAERDALRAQCYAECAAICRKAEDWSDGSLGWNRACKRMAIAIEHALAEGKP